MAPKQACRQIRSEFPDVRSRFCRSSRRRCDSPDSAAGGFAACQGRKSRELLGQPRTGFDFKRTRLPSMPQPARRRLTLPMDLSFGATDEADQPLPVAGFKGTSEEIERQWYEQVYRGHGDSMAQLTWRAVLMGSCLGAVLSLTNLYIGLKAGWGFGVAITASILSHAIWTSLLKVGIARTPMTILENNCMQSTASSAGYSTGGTLISAFAAYIIINRHSMSVPLMLAWVFFIAVLGVTMAIPMKRQMINVEQLRFPSGIAAAETLRALHAKSSRGLHAAKALGFAGLIAAIDKFWAEGLSTISASLERFTSAALLTSLQKQLLGVTTQLGRAAPSSSPGISYLSPPAPSSACGSAPPCSSRARYVGLWSCRSSRPAASSKAPALPSSCNGPSGSARPAWWPLGS